MRRLAQRLLIVLMLNLTELREHNYPSVGEE